LRESIAAPPLAEQYENAVVSSGFKIPCCKLLCKGPQAIDVLHGVVPIPVALGKPKIQCARLYLRLSGVEGELERMIKAVGVTSRLT